MRYCSLVYFHCLLVFSSAVCILAIEAKLKAMAQNKDKALSLLPNERSSISVSPVVSYCSKQETEKKDFIKKNRLTHRDKPYSRYRRK